MRRSARSVAKLSYSKHLLSITVVLSSSRYLKYRRPKRAKHKKRPTRRLSNSKKIRQLSLRRLRNRRKLAY